MKRRVLSLVLALCMAAGMAGCGSSEKDKSGKSASAGGDRKQISMWFWGCATPYQEHMQKVLVDNYNESQEEYWLTLEFRNTVDKDIPVALAADSGPDIVYGSGPSYVSTYVQEGKVISLDKYAEQYGWKDRMLGILYDACTVDGSLYSIPNSISVGGIFYNKALFEEKGWEVPTTVEELTAIMDEAMKDGLYGSLAGNKGWKPCNDNFSSLMVSHFTYPSVMYDCLSGKTPFNNPEMAEAIELSKEWYEKGYLGGSDYTDLDSQECMQMLSEKKSPFILAPTLYFQFAGQFFTGELEDDLGFIPFPSLQSDQPSPVYDVATPCNFSISATTPYADECAKILDTMLTEDFLVEMTKGWPGYWATPLKEITVDENSIEGLGGEFIGAVKEACTAIDNGQFSFHPTTFMPPETQEKWRDIDMVWQGVMTPEEFLDSVDAVFPAELEKNLVSPLAEPARAK